MNTHDETLRGAGGHDVPLTPPPAQQPSTVTFQAGQPQQAPGGPQKHGSGAKAIAIVTACVGGVALLATGVTAAVTASWSFTSDSSSEDHRIVADVDGMTEFRMEVGAADVTVLFGDVEQAELAVTNGRSDWMMERNGDELVVNSPSDNFRFWSFDDWDSEEKVVITLPQHLEDEALSADLFIGAGSLDVNGDFGAVSFEVGAGALEIDGAVTDLEADISAGRATLNLTDVRTADLTISAGRLTADFTGEAPDEVVFDVSAGSLTLTLPDEEYDVRQDVSAGSLDNELKTNQNAPRFIDGEVSAGSATLRANS